MPTFSLSGRQSLDRHVSPAKDHLAHLNPGRKNPERGRALAFVDSDNPSVQYRLSPRDVKASSIVT